MPTEIDLRTAKAVLQAVGAQTPSDLRVSAFMQFVYGKTFVLPIDQGHRRRL